MISNDLPWFWNGVSLILSLTNPKEKWLDWDCKEGWVGENGNESQLLGFMAPFWSCTFQDRKELKSTKIFKNLIGIKGQKIQETEE